MAVAPQLPSFRLDGCRALVAGASSGIGLACAAALVQSGAHVFMAARGADRLRDAVAAMADLGGTAEGLALDLTDIDAMRSAVAENGPFDVLVNSMGHARHGPALETTPEDFDAVMNVNVRAAYFLAQAVARGLVQAGRPGSIIQISSQMGHVGGIDRGVYCAAKHAVEGMTKTMAIEWGGHGIRVNTLSPTFIRTPLTQSTFDNPERRAWIESRIKLGRVGEVEDIMGAVVYLASPASALVTGTSLRVDGGWTAE
ncbi:SDR family NAD(P)-dependent oxidoreductase [Alkalilacustris brevis]|uniref:SDR family NAD(P)-dependent oxidoreductase n=1 Tax=Alkalilacustris brevis TaxID=2026338 RepID=UPI000E0D663B|nr:SDR family oxidoreductase [Alkalilacustris brevis]